VQMICFRCAPISLATPAIRPNAQQTVGQNIEQYTPNLIFDSHSQNLHWLPQGCCLALGELYLHPQVKESGRTSWPAYGRSLYFPSSIGCGG
jgi:hypothetical protein